MNAMNIELQPSIVLRLLACTFAGACLLLPQSSVGSEWREFRGPRGSSVADRDVQVPASFDVATGENIAWQADLPGRGVCGPIVSGGRVVVTASSGKNRDRLHVLGFDELTGKQLWHRQFWASGRSHCHPTSANAAPTPTTDGERVFAFYSSNDLVCLDLDGNLQWYRGLALDHPGLGNDVGMSSSPVVAGDVVVVQCDCQANSFAAAYDRLTGEEAWRVDRPAAGNWASPVAIDVVVDGQPVPAVVLQSGESLTAYTANNGTMLWEVPVECSRIPSASGGEGVLFVPSEEGLAAVATSADLQGSRIVWTDAKLKPGNPSPIVANGQLLIVNRAGVLTSASPEDGSSNWKKRLGGRYWATPVVAGTRLFALNDSGEAIVVDLASGEIMGKFSLGEGEEVLGSPAVAGNALFVRSHRHLWKIAAQSP